MDATRIVDPGPALVQATIKAVSVMARLAYVPGAFPLTTSRDHVAPEAAVNGRCATTTRRSPSFNSSHARYTDRPATAICGWCGTPSLGTRCRASKRRPADISE